MKVRGTAAHIFDKYQALARDASSSGDRIAAENYLQHAEHYFRLMAAAQAAQQQQQQGSQAPQGNQPRSNGQATHLAGDGADGDGLDTQPPANGGNGQQPEQREERAASADSEDGDAQADGDDQSEEATA